MSLKSGSGKFEMLATPSTGAKEDFENSVREMILSYTENGQEVHDELKDVEFVYKYDMASMFNEHSRVVPIKSPHKAILSTDTNSL